MTEEEFDSLVAECERHLDPAWSWAFPLFMGASTLGPARLFAWAQAFLAASPERPSRKRYALHQTTISKWRKRLMGDALVEHKRHIEDRNGNLGFQYVVAYLPIATQETKYSRTTLVIVFERTTETLAHHLIHTDIRAAAVWHVILAAEAEARAKRSVSAEDRLTRTIEMPQELARSPLWLEVCRDTRRRSPRDEGRRTGTSSRRMRVEMQWGRSRFTVDPNCWQEQTPAVTIQVGTLIVEDDNESGMELLHKTLQTAASAVTRFFRTLPPTPGHPASRPSWIALSRSCRSKQ